MCVLCADKHAILSTTSRDEESLRRVKEEDRFFKSSILHRVLRSYASGTNQRPRKSSIELPNKRSRASVRARGVVLFPSVFFLFFPLSFFKTKQSGQEEREREGERVKRAFYEKDRERRVGWLVVLSRRSSRVKRTSRPENLCHVVHTTRKNLEWFSRSRLRALPRLTLLPPPATPSSPHPPSRFFSPANAIN